MEIWPHGSKKLKRRLKLMILNQIFINMKKLLFILALILLNSISYSQTYKSAYVIKQKIDFETELKDRIITINDKEISISNFSGGTKTMYLIVNKIEEKEYDLESKCKFYYCTTKDKDFINGYQKAIVIKKYDTIILSLFATEIDIYTYQFSISN
jgi:hypothetical protein